MAYDEVGMTQLAELVELLKMALEALGFGVDIEKEQGISKRVEGQN